MNDAEDQFLLDRLNRKHIVRSIFYCSSCTFLFQNPTYSENELHLLYNPEGRNTAEYYESAGKSAEQLWASPEALRNDALRKEFYSSVILTLGGASILDYGGGNGVTLTHPRLGNKQRFVFDFGKNQNYISDGIVPLEKLDGGQSFDFILCTHVLEHIPEPVSTLKTFRRSISARGYLLLEVPFDFTERMISRRPGAVWHVNYFNRKSLLQAAGMSGWDCSLLRIKQMPYSNRYQACILGIFVPKGSRPRHTSTVSKARLVIDMIGSLIRRIKRSLPR